MTSAKINFSQTLSRYPTLGPVLEGRRCPLCDNEIKPIKKTVSTWRCPLCLSGFSHKSLRADLAIIYGYCCGLTANAICNFANRTLPAVTARLGELRALAHAANASRLKAPKELDLRNLGCLPMEVVLPGRSGWLSEGWLFYFTDGKSFQFTHLPDKPGAARAFLKTIMPLMQIPERKILINALEASQDVWRKNILPLLNFDRGIPLTREEAIEKCIGWAENYKRPLASGKLLKPTLLKLEDNLGRYERVTLSIFSNCLKDVQFLCRYSLDDSFDKLLRLWATTLVDDDKRGKIGKFLLKMPRADASALQEEPKPQEIQKKSPGKSIKKNLRSRP